MEFLEQRSFSFDSIPEGEPYISLKKDGYALGRWAWATSVISLLLPKDVPRDLLPSLVSEELSTGSKFGMIMYHETAVATCILFGVTIGVVTPFVGIVLCICRHCGKCQESSVYQKRFCYFCLKRSYTFVVCLLSLLLLIGFTIIILSKEFLEASLRTTEIDLQNHVQDLGTFMRNSRSELKFLVENSFDQSSSAFFTDLDEIEYYLGRPLQREMVENSKLEASLSAIIEVDGALRSIGGRLKSLESLRHETSVMEEELRTRLRILKDSIDSVLMKCSTMDQLLCDSIDTSGLILTTSFKNISLLHSLDILDFVAFQNLTEFAFRTQHKFGSIPALVAISSDVIREDIKRTVRDHRFELNAKLNRMEVESQEIEIRISGINDYISFFMTRLNSWRFVTQSIELSLVSTFGTLVFVQTLAAILTVCISTEWEKIEKKQCTPNKVTGLTLSSSVMLTFTASCFLWVLSVFILLFATQVQVLICRPLQEEPDFPALTTLVEKDGVLFPEEGMFNSLLPTKSKMNLEIKTILNRCKDNRTIYDVFKLSRFFDLNSEFEFLKNSSLTTSLHKIQHNLTQLNLAPSESENQIGQIIQSVNIDLASIRRQFEQPLLGLNVKNFVNQMQRVAGQLQSSETSSELFRLVYQTRYFIANVLEPVETRKEDLTYRVSTLDYEVTPLKRKINDSAVHLNRFYQYIRIQGPAVIEEKINEFSERLAEYFRLYSEHVQQSASNDAAKCIPIWQLFESARSCICGGLVDPITSIGISSYLCLIVFLLTIYFNLRLSSYFYGMKKVEDASLLNESDILASLISTSQSENNLWVTPGSYRNFNGFSSEQPTANLRAHHVDHLCLAEQRRNQQESARELAVASRSPSNHNISASCSPRCSHHMNAMTNNLLLPHVINHEDSQILRNVRMEPYLQIDNSRPMQISSRSSRPPVERGKQIRKMTYSEEPFPRIGNCKVHRSSSSVSQLQQMRPGQLSTYETPFRRRRDSSLSLGGRTSDESEMIFRPLRQNVNSNKASSHSKIEVATTSKQDGKHIQTHDSGSNVVAMAQVTAWKEAALAGAHFVTPEFVAIQVKKTSSWVKKYWDLDPKTLARNVFNSDEPKSANKHRMLLFCSNKLSHDYLD